MGSKPIINLLQRFGQETPVQALQETLEYAISPKNYLLRRLGEDVVEERAGLLCIPEELVDRDMYGTGVHKQHFERHIAELLGKKQGTFFITGIQAQMAAIKIHTRNVGRDIVSWHYRCHLEIYEEEAFSELFHLQRLFIGSSQREVPSAADIKTITSLPLEERPAVMILELPNRELGCKTYPFKDLVEISKVCREAGVKLHLDGARLWEIEPFYGKGFEEIAGLFDSVYVSFYKGLKGVCGAMLVSSEEGFIDEAKLWQRRMGGNMVTSYTEIIDNERGFNLNIGTFHTKWQKMTSVATAIKEATKSYRTKEDRPIVFFEPDVPTCCQIRTHIQGVSAEKLIVLKAEVEKELGIDVLRRPQPFVDFGKMHGEGTPMVRKSAGDDENEEKEGKEVTHLWIEWMVGNENGSIADEVFAAGWGALAKKIAEIQ